MSSILTLKFISLITSTCFMFDHELLDIKSNSQHNNHSARNIEFIPAQEDGGWIVHSGDRIAPVGPCTIEVRHAKHLSQKDFILEYAFTKPVVIKGASNNEAFKNLTRREALLNTYGASKISLSSANSYSYDRRTIRFKQYCDDYIKPQSLSTLANETFYFFGDNGNEDWKPLVDNYNLPPYTLPKHIPQLSFGVAGPGSGVPFHFHGPGFAETIWGRKRWFMLPPHVIPEFHPNHTTLQWLYEDYLKIKDDPEFLECTLIPGEIIYFPNHWWHATLNIDVNVFISTFLGL